MSTISESHFAFCAVCSASTEARGLCVALEASKMQYSGPCNFSLCQLRLRSRGRTCGRDARVSLRQVRSRWLSKTRLLPSCHCHHTLHPKLCTQLCLHTLKNNSRHKVLRTARDPPQTKTECFAPVYEDESTWCAELSRARLGPEGPAPSKTIAEIPPHMELVGPELGTRPLLFGFSWSIGCCSGAVLELGSVSGMAGNSHL